MIVKRKKWRKSHVCLRDELSRNVQLDRRSVRDRIAGVTSVLGRGRPRIMLHTHENIMRS